MNIIQIVIDTLRQDHVGAYGNPWIKTPNLDRFARQAAKFTNAYPEALPTIPIRTQLSTGNRTLPYRPWQPMVSTDRNAAGILGAYGYTSALITDTYHMMKPNMNFHQNFHVYRWIRGQESDAYESAPHSKNLNDYTKADWPDRAKHMTDQYLRNIEEWKSEDDTFPARVFTEAARWVERNARNEKPFFLWVDSFDPHEPWNPPEQYLKLYADPNYKGKKYIHPPYGRTDWMTADELQHVRALYAGEVTLVDKWLGVLLDKIEKCGLFENSLVLIMADHGHPIGDHGWVMKHDHQMYSELLKVPFMIRHPKGLGAGQTFAALVQFHDVLPTYLAALGRPQDAEGMHGRSFMPVLEGQTTEHRPYILTGYHTSAHACVRDKRHSFVLRPRDWGEDELYDLIEDPKETKNLIQEKPGVAQELAGKIPGWYGFKNQRAQIDHLQLKHEIADTPVK